MKKILSTNIFIIISLIGTFSFSQEYKGLYIDNFNTIIGNSNKIDSLLNYVKANKFNALTFYNLHQIDFNSSIEVQKLKNFISLAKNDYNVNEFIATAENFWFFENKILPYQQQANVNERFTGLNLEFEFWVPESVSGYYCSTYLQPNGYSCDENGAFQFFMNELNSIYTLAQNNQLKTEIYLGWFNQNQADLMKQKCDRILLSNYNQNPDNCFDYSLLRLQYLGNSSPTIEVATLFSGENEFLNPWLVQNNYNLDTCYNIFKTEYNNENATWKNNVNLVGQQWFTYTKLPYYLPEEQNTTEIIENQNEILLFTNPVSENCVIYNYKNEKNNINLYDCYGNKVPLNFQNENTIYMGNLNNGIYFIQLNNKTYKLLKY